MTTATIRPLELTAAGMRLRGIRYTPADAGPHPTAVLFHGFGGNRVETSGVFVRLARELTAAGIGVIAYDRAGHGESDGDFFDTTVSRDIAHAHEVLEAITALPGVDRDDLHLVGMSLGAVVASVVAAESALSPRSLTMWSSAAVFTDEIRGGTLQGMPLGTLDTDGYFDFLGMRLGPAMRTDALSFDVYGRAAGYAGPVRLLHGTEDFVPLAYAERYREVYRERGELIVVEGADHGWMRVPHRDIVIARTVEFVAANAVGR